MITISVEYRGLSELKDRFEAMPGATDRAIASAVMEVTELVYQQAQQNIRSMFRTSGKMESALKTTFERFAGGACGTVSISGIGYVTQELGGRGFYDIFPRGNALRWLDTGGREVFAKHVHHPPLPERSFLRLALDQKREEIRGLFEAAAHRVVTGRAA